MMQNLKTENNTWIYYSVLVIICTPFIFYWLGLQELFASPLSIGITSAVISVCLIKVCGRVCTKKDLLLLLVVVFSLLLNYIRYGNIGANLTLYNIIVLLIIFNNVNFSKNQAQQIRLVTILLLLVFLFTLKVEPFYSSIRVYNLKGNMINQNTFGLLVLALYFQSFTYINYRTKNKILKVVLLVVLTLLSMKYIYLSKSRSALISLVLFIILYFIKIVNLKNYKKMLICMIIAIFVIPFIYQSALSYIGNIQLFGKSIATRSLVWESTINLIATHPILGCGTESDILMDSGGYTSSAHNVFLGVWKTLGIIPMVTLMIYLVRGKNISNVSMQNYLPKLAFLCCMLVCVFETMLNDSNTYLFYITLLISVKESQIEQINDN